ncbi:MAG: hypothetical protein ABS69_13690 [Nitrosomonadales bacterium SCN 54-20]|nr:MAG: hypothetical protein ABS69_13690 [Nitrosomonadales bacterium SCN 54-20]
MSKPLIQSNSNASSQSDTLEIEQTRLLYEHLPLSIVINLLLASILVYIQRSVIELAILAGWLISIFLVMLYRAALLTFRHHNKANNILSWKHYFRVGVFATGLTWGIGSIVLFPAGSMFHQVLLSFVVAGLAAGGITALAADRVSVLSFLSLVLIPLIARFLVEGNEISLSMGVMGAFFLIAISQNALRMGRTLQENIKLRIDAVAREQMLKRSEERLNQAQQTALLGSFDWNPASGELTWSDEHFRLWGLKPHVLTPSYTLFREAIHPEDIINVEEALQQALRGGGIYNCTHRVRWPNGSEHHIQGRGEIIVDDSGQIRMTGTVQDITAYKQVEEALQEGQRRLQELNQNLEQIVVERTSELRESEGRFRILFEQMAVGVAQIALTEGRFVRVNQKFADITGYTTAEILALDFQSLAHPADLKIALVNMERLGTGEIREFEMEKRLFHKDGRDIWIKLTVSPMCRWGAKPDHLILVIQDITRHKQAEEQVHELAFHDSLTRLPNRRLFLDRLQQAQIHSARQKTHCAILFIDLDNFKALNDTRGHDVGDLLLIEIARRLQSNVRNSDTVSRLGGDEFVVIIEGLSEDTVSAASQAKDIGEKLLASITQPFKLQEFEYHGSSSIGIRLFHADETRVDDLLKQADTAMYQAKAAGRNTLCFFDPSMQIALERRTIMAIELRQAIVRQQLRLHYQKQVNAEGTIVGAEVLLRWLHPHQGMISPMTFIPIAEETGLIVSLGKWVLQIACEQLKQWEQKPDTRNLQLAVNISARQFHQLNFVDEVLEVLQKSGADPHRLKLELTESLVLKDIDDSIQKMDILCGAGIRFALDDFGTGYSSLAYLKRLPVEQIKIDRSFVRDISRDLSDEVIVRTIIVMSNTLGMKVIAEGVETEDQRDILARNGCYTYQGYLFGKPLPIEDFLKH